MTGHRATRSATIVRVEISDAIDFVRTHDRTVLSTRRRDGSPQMSAVNAGVVDGAICISSRAMLAKIRNIRRDPLVSLLVLKEEFYGGWVQIDGTAEIVDQPEALELLVEVFRSIRGEHPDWDDYRAAMIRDQRVVIRVTPTRAVQG
jgi:PPOX class probable F420-dependent enzyme